MAGLAPAAGLTGAVLAQTSLPVPGPPGMNGGGASSPGRTAGVGVERRAAGPAAEHARELPPDASTRHTLEPPGRTLYFTATAGSLRLSGPAGEPQADIAYVDYRLDAPEPRALPVAFVLNGGPGVSSAWLQLGALGPWRLPLAGDSGLP